MEPRIVERLHDFNRMPRRAGIYRIYAGGIDRSYVGSSENVRERLGSHVSDLGRKRHPCSDLQSLFDEPSRELYVEVLEPCEANQLDDREAYWMGHYGWPRLFNKPGAGRRRCIGPRVDGEGKPAQDPGELMALNLFLTAAEHVALGEWAEEEYRTKRMQAVHMIRLLLEARKHDPAIMVRLAMLPAGYTIRVDPPEGASEVLAASK